jgi:hypothetical protein
MRFVKVIFLFCVMIIYSGCAAHTNLEPIGKGEVKMNVSLGGPFVKISGMNVPIPYATAGAVYGAVDKLNVSGNLHLTSLPYKIFGFDFGAAYFPVLNDGYIPTIGINPSLLYLMSLKPDVSSRVRAYPSLTATFAWHTGANLVFTGFDYTYPLTTPDYDSDSPKSIISPFVGYRIELGRKFRLITEVKWQASNVRTDQLAAEYSKISGRGAIGLLFSLERSF